MTQAVDIDDGRARIPMTAFDHQGFRHWVRSGELPPGVVVSFVAGEVLIEMSPAATESHNKPKTKVTAALDRLITERDLGEAPLRGQVGVGAERDHRAAGAQLGVERSLPAHPGLDALLRVEVEEDRAMSLLLELGLES